ncbi:unnamed protein product [Linum tenue]|uniref:Uncharacterized protein n=1 Tax=Linum tenue TaxID=586396 RepID=A0AAV0HDU6_9ROSI|nr:unnamed protein product [Linum tenue]
MGRRSSSSSFRRSGILLICAILAAHLAISTSKAIDFLPALNSPGAGCNGSIAECMAAGSVGDDNGDGEEFAMESESEKKNKIQKKGSIKLLGRVCG